MVKKLKKRKMWKSYTLYFKECRECASMIECLKHGKKCLTEG